MKGYVTLKNDFTYEFTEKRSVFIGCAHPVSSEEEAAAFVSSIRKKYPDARHVAYAYSITSDRCETKRFSDDGEPQGTAGKPILDVLDKQEITNAVITVTRYFGGILLGAPGLLRAYTAVASGAVSGAEVGKVSVCRRVTAVIDYDLYGRIEKLYQSFGAVPEPPVFSDKISVSYAAEESCCEMLMKAFTDATAGRAELDLSDPFYFTL